jgi:hypothetical protein
MGQSPEAWEAEFLGFGPRFWPKSIDRRSSIRRITSALGTLTIFRIASVNLANSGLSGGGFMALS